MSKAIDRFVAAVGAPDACLLIALGEVPRLAEASVVDMAR